MSLFATIGAPAGVSSVLTYLPLENGMEWLLNPQPKLKRIGKLLGYFLLLLSVPSWPHEVRDQFDAWRRNVPLWLFGLSGLVLLGILYAADWRLRRMGAPLKQQRAPHSDGLVDGLKQTLAQREFSLEATIKERDEARRSILVLEREQRVLRERIASCAMELETANASRDEANRAFKERELTAEAERLRLLWLLEYGRHKPELEPLPDQDLRTARTEISRLRVVLQDVWRTFEPLDVRLYNTWIGKGDDSAERLLALFLAEQVSGPTKRSFRLLDEQIEHGADPRVSLILFYDRYNGWRRMLTQVAAIDPTLLAASDYRLWRDADRKLFERLKEALAVRELKEVSGSIRTINANHNYPVSMPWDS